MQLTQTRQRVLENSPIRDELQRYLACIEQTPAAHTVRGMYVGGLVQAIAARNFVPINAEPIHPFKEYSLREYMEMLLDSAISLYPSDTVHDGLRKLGNLAIPTFAKSLAGSVLMAMVGRRWDLALTCVSRGYEVSLNPGKCIVAENANGRALLQLRNVWNFGDSYQVGVIEGLMQWCKLEGTVTAVLLAPCDVDLRIEWKTAHDAVRNRFRVKRPPASDAHTARNIR